MNIISDHAQSSEVTLLASVKKNAFKFNEKLFLNPELNQTGAAFSTGSSNQQKYEFWFKKILLIGQRNYCTENDLKNAI